MLSRSRRYANTQCTHAVQIRNNLPPVKAFRPRLCLSIYGRDISELVRNFSRALTYKPDFVELRLDYMERPRDSIVSQIPQLTRSNVILTLRSPAQGGKSRISEKEKVRIIQSLASSPAMVDIEIETARENPKLLNELKTKSSGRIIFSHHDFHSTPGRKEMRAILASAPKGPFVFAIKLACKANSFEDNLAVLSLYNGWKQSKLIAFCVGPLGILSRFASLELGAPFTYVSLPGEKATASGQLDIETMKRALGMRV
jgi:3-dehydroquinate dehydratase type I